MEESNELYVQGKNYVFSFGKRKKNNHTLTVEIGTYSGVSCGCAYKNGIEHDSDTKQQKTTSSKSIAHIPIQKCANGLLLSNKFIIALAYIFFLSVELRARWKKSFRDCIDVTS